MFLVAVGALGFGCPAGVYVWLEVFILALSVEHKTLRNVYIS